MYEGIIIGASQSSLLGLLLFNIADMLLSCSNDIVNYADDNMPYAAGEYNVTANIESLGKLSFLVSKQLHVRPTPANPVQMMRAVKLESEAIRNYSHKKLLEITKSKKRNVKNAFSLPFFSFFSPVWVF